MFGSSRDLGFDDTVERVRVHSADKKVKYAYRYTCQGTQGKKRVFQTIGDPISEEGAYPIVSRANRVWEVGEVKLDQDGNVVLDGNGDTIFISDDIYVLKDSWLYENARLEGDIQREIFSELSEADADEARKFFLTILVENVVEWDGEADVTPVCPRCDRTRIDWTMERSGGPRSSAALAERRDRIANSKSAEAKTRSSIYRTFDARKHVRIVFKERGRCMYEVTDLRRAFQCLLGCVKGAFVAPVGCCTIDLAHVLYSALLHEESRVRSS